MKRNLKVFVSSAILYLLISHNPVVAKSLTVYIDSIPDWDTLAVCEDFDTIEVIGIQGTEDGYFCYYDSSSDYYDTVYSDTLLLKPSYNSMIVFEGYFDQKRISKTIGIVTLIFSVTQDLNYNYYLNCNETSRFILYTNYKGEAIYSWWPEEGVSDPKIADPEVFVDSIREYTVTLFTQEGCSATDTVSLTIEPMKQPEICIVGIDSLNKNRIIWNKPISTRIDSFFLYKETDVTDKYEKIATIAYDEYTYFTDTASNPRVQSNKYRLSFVDVCGIESRWSEPHKTMHLAINQGINDTWNLIWEPYRGFQVVSYYIYRGTDTIDLEMIGSTSSSSTQFTDLDPPAEDVYYQIEVLGPNDCNPFEATNKKLTNFNVSRSNIASNEEFTGASRFTQYLPIEVYPNPSSGSVFIEQPLFQNEMTTIEILTIQGEILKNVEKYGSLVEVDITDLTNGLYFLRVEGSEGIFVGKIIKQ